VVCAASRAADDEDLAIGAPLARRQFHDLNSIEIVPSPIPASFERWTICYPSTAEPVSRGGHCPNMEPSGGASHFIDVGLPWKECTMIKTTTMILSGLTALSVGIGSAMAQNETPVVSSDMPSTTATTVQSGSSDIEASAYGASNLTPFDGDYTTLANPG
jgi:hypothetical protein